MPQARMTMESDAIVELESRFTAEDTRLFRMAAKRTLPELPIDAADATNDARSGHLIASPCISQLWGYEGDSHVQYSMFLLLAVIVAGCSGACRLRRVTLATCRAKLRSARYPVDKNGCAASVHA